MDRSVSANADTDLLAGKRVLIVDDDDDARYLLRVVLEGCQMTVCDSDSADKALEELDQTSFDLLVSDIGMPERDGYSLIRAVRGRSDSESIPAVALTSFGRPEDRARALRAGFNRHLRKPFTSSSLLLCLASLLEQATGCS
jgi:CheY-like chemotaxis protein